MESNMKVTLHYFPGSFFSHRVLLALYEKHVKFDEHIVNILLGEQLKPDFLKANNKGNVPVLEIDGTFYSESEHIIDVVDQTFNTAVKLVPEVGTSVGDAVRDFRKLMYEIPIDQITYGVIANRHVMKDPSCSRHFPPTFSRTGIRNKFLGEAKKIKVILDASEPGMREALEKKIQIAETRAEVFLDEANLIKNLDFLETLFDKINDRLEQTKRENPGVQETWLVGTSFTAADISALTLFYRLEFVGMAPRYFSDSVRPNVNEYYIRMLARPSMKKLNAKVDEMKKMFIKAKLKSVGLTVLKVGACVGLVGGLGYMGYKVFTRGSNSS
ncbi:Ganglioside-induced differentiation-associated protein 1 [Mactra antiquata]